MPERVESFRAMTVLEAIQLWVSDYQDKHFKLRVAGAITSILCSLPVLIATWWIVYGILWFAFFGGTGFALTMTTYGVVALLFVAYLTANYEELENLKIGPPGQAATVRRFARATGQGYMSIFANQETFHSFVKILSVSILAGPALVMTGIRLARSAQALKNLDPEFVAPVLIQLAKANKRVPFDRLAEKLGDRSIGDLIEQMALIDGVIIRTEGNSGMYLTEDLQASLANARDARKEA